SPTVPAPTPTVAPSPARSAAVASPSAPPTAAPPATPVPTSAPSVALTGSGSVHGTAFVDSNADGQLTPSEQRLTNVQLTLTFANGLARTTLSDETGHFSFDGLAAGLYHVALTIPQDYVPTTDAGADVEVVDGSDTVD